MKSSSVVITIILCLSVLIVTPVVKADEPIEIVFSTMFPPSYEYVHRPTLNFMENVEKASKGRVKFKFYHSGELYGGMEELHALERGDIDMGIPNIVYYTDIMPEVGVIGLPFIAENHLVMQQVIDEGLFVLGIEQQLLKKNAVLLSVTVGDPYQIYSKGFSVKLPEDLKGKKWGTSSTTAEKMVEVAGGTPVNLGSSKLYAAFQNNEIDGCIRPLLTGLGRNLYEVADHLTITHMSYFATVLLINRNTWESLPPDIQDIMKNAAKIRSEEQLKMVDVFLEDALQELKKKNMNIHTLTEDELQQFKKSVSPVYEWWIKMVPNGKDYIDFVLLF